MVFSLLFGTSSSSSQAISKLKIAEERLFQLAVARYGDNGGDNPGDVVEFSSSSFTTFTSDASSYQTEVMDTRIQSSSIPLQSIENDPLTMHSIRVTRVAHDQKDLVVSTSPLVLLHGYMNGAMYYYRNLLGLSKYFPSVYSLDCLGWGLSSRPAFRPLTSSVRSTEGVFVESLEAWRKEQKLEKMVLAGHSMGGYLAVAYCERYPHRVDRLILISPVGVPIDSNQDSRGRSSWTSRFIRLLYDWDWTPGSILRSLPQERGRGMIQTYLEKRLPSLTERPDEVQALTDYLYYSNATLPPSGEYALQRLLTPHAYARDPTVHRIPNLQVPHVSFLYGDNDWMDISGGLQVQKLRSDVQVYQIPKSGHLLMLENWIDFEKAMYMAAGGPNVEGPIKIGS